MMPCGCIIYHPLTTRACECECHEPTDLTPNEVAGLRLIADRAAADRADLAPMLWDGKVIPWLAALNLDPTLGV